MLVVGASGVIGGAHLRHLAGREGVQAIALARRPPEAAATNQRSLALDLTAPLSDDLRDPAAELLRPVTHLVYAAFVDAPGWQAQRALNAALFATTLDLAARCCQGLRHVTLLQGMKAYGSHLGPFKTPARESDPRIPEGHFYFDQQDHLVARAARHGWSWTVLRPHVVIGPARRSPQNLIAVLGVYASLLRAQGRPLAFPGPAAAFDAVYQATDAELLSKAIDWAGEAPRAAGEVFNITNGDFFRWRHVWPRIAGLFGMAPAGLEPVRLAQTMAGAGALWQRVTAEYGLERHRLDSLVSWPFADYIFNTTWDVMADTLKCRRAGFLEFLDSEQMLLDRLDELRRLRLVP